MTKFRVMTQPAVYRQTAIRYLLYKH